MELYQNASPRTTFSAQTESRNPAVALMIVPLLPPPHPQNLQQESAIFKRFTPLKFDIALENRPNPKRKRLVFQPSILRCFFSLASCPGRGNALIKGLLREVKQLGALHPEGTTIFTMMEYLRQPMEVSLPATLVFFRNTWMSCWYLVNGL